MAEKLNSTLEMGKISDSYYVLLITSNPVIVVMVRGTQYSGNVYKKGNLAKLYKSHVYNMLHYLVKQACHLSPILRGLIFQVRSGGSVHGSSIVLLSQLR